MNKKTILTISFAIIIGVFVISILTISFEPPPPQQQQQQDVMETLVFGIIPLEDQVTTPENFKNTIKYLEKSLEMKVETFITEDYEGIVDALNNDLVDVALLGGHSFVIASTYNDSVEVFATGVRSDTGSSTYHSIIVTHKDSNIKSINDLKENANNVTFSFVDPYSTSGFLMPMEAMFDIKLDPQRHFSEVSILGGHDKVLLAVNYKEVIAGAISDITYNTMTKQGIINPDDVIIIWESEELQGLPFVMRKDLSSDLKEKIKNSFYSMHYEKTPEEFLGGWGNIIAYELVTEYDYEYAFRAAKKLGII